MVRFSINPKKTALLIIDMQNGFLKPGAVVEVAAGRAIIPKLKKLMFVCRAKGIPVIFTKHVHRADGSDMGLHFEFMPQKVCIAGTRDVEFYREIEPEAGDIVVEKHRFDAFIGTDLDLILRSKHLDTLIIGGVSTHMCCESTARAARMRDYRVIFLSDGTATYDLSDTEWGTISADEIQRFVLAILAYRFAQVSSVGDIINQLS